MVLQMQLNKFFQYSFYLIYFIKFIIEKCSESTGKILTLYFFTNFLIKSHPQITDSLFAIRIFFTYFNYFKVGSSPAIPGIAEYRNI